MGFVILTIKKPHGTDSGTTAHIERKVKPGNADEKRSHLNKEFIEFPEGVKNRTQAIQHRLKHAGISRKIGKNQVRVLQVILSGSPDDMKRIVSEGHINDWYADNLDWLGKTFGTENVVSVVVHNDEDTPHMHASVVPIVTGERRKAGADTGKKKYRKKDESMARLCADDVMARDKLKGYQDSYAEAMKKYGLQRGIEGSKAKRVSTTQYYRDVLLKTEQLMENISHLLKQQEQLIAETNALKQQKEDAQTKYIQADIQAKEKESELQKKQKELKQIKGQAKTEELKNSLTNVATNLSDTVGNLFGSSKMKTLEDQNRELRDQLDTLQVCIREIKDDYEKQLVASRKEIGRIYNLIPNIGEMLKMENLCHNIGFDFNAAKNLINGKSITVSGSLYSEAHQRKFNADKSKVNIEKAPDNLLRLCIDGMEISNWFAKKHQETREAARPQVRQMQTPVQPRRQGIRM